jgi:hypothetical protein
MKKGRIAENIVSSMFKEAGFKVIKYGYEYTVPQLANRNNLIKGKAAAFIRHQPDFIVVNKKNEAFFIEVKFRSKEIKPDKDIFNYPNCYVVLLTKSYILAQSTKYLFKKKIEFQPITKMPPFKNIPWEVLEKYIVATRRHLGDETLSQQLLGALVKNFTNLQVLQKKKSPIKVTRTTKSNGKGNVKAQKKRWRNKFKNK